MTGVAGTAMSLAHDIARGIRDAIGENGDKTREAVSGLEVTVAQDIPDAIGENGDKTREVVGGLRGDMGKMLEGRTGC